MSEWIKLKDRAPAAGQNVIAVGTWWGEINGEGEDDYMGIGTWRGDCVRIDSDTYTTEIVDVTHWMKLPEWPNA